MYCLYQIGRTATPIQCTNDCPFRQKFITWTNISDAFKKEYPFPPELFENFTEKFVHLRQRFRFIGHYQYQCVQWNLVVDETVHHVLMNDAYHLTELTDALSQINQ